ncbi:MAG TPA: hypothetical protein VEQ60_11000 [Longimicrobium sp.]|nr:hypothetical protein [Longimicrobium sp.]
MFRSRPLLAAVLCTAGLAACSNSATGTSRGGDPLVNATNRNLASEVVFDATQSETVTPGIPGPLEYSAYCPIGPSPVTSVSVAEGGGAGSDEVDLISDPCFSPYPEEPTYPLPPPVQQPLFDTPVGSITGSTSLGNKTVNLNASGAFDYASFGQLTAIFQNAGGCSSTPTEYSRSTVSAQNGPFTLSASRSASYNGTTTYINWGLHVTSYAESPEGGALSKISTRTFCY